MRHLLALIDDNALVSICGVVVALSVPLNTWLSTRVLKRQKEGNHHTETIRKLASALADTPVDAPPEEVGERVTEALTDEEASHHEPG